MSNDIAARREARRQKILNNSENRLRRIVDDEKLPIAGPVENGPSLPKTDNTPTTSRLSEERTLEVRTIFLNPKPPRASSVNELSSLEVTVKARRCTIAIMALLMRCIMLILEEYFTYFFKTSFANFHLNKPPPGKFGSLAALLSLRMDPQRVRGAMGFLNAVTRVSQDVAVYFVTFISFDCVISMILEGR